MVVSNFELSEKLRTRMQLLERDKNVKQILEFIRSQQSARDDIENDDTVVISGNVSIEGSLSPHGKSAIKLEGDGNGELIEN